MNKKIFILSVFLAAIPFLIFPESPLDQAKKYYEMKRYDHALKLYKKVKNTYPDSDWDVMAHVMTARIYEHQRKFDSAVGEYKKVIKKFSDKPQAEEAFFAIGRLRTVMGDPSKSVKAYQAYLKVYTNGVYGAMALFNIANLLKEKGKHRQALEYYGEVLKKHANEPWFYSWSAIYSGHIYSHRKDYDKAIEIYSRVIRTDSNKFLYNLATLHRGQAYLDKKDYNAAKAVFQSILKESSDFSEEALYGLGKANYMSGDYEMSKEVLETLVQMFPSTVWKKDVEMRLKKINKKLKK